MSVTVHWIDSDAALGQAARDWQQRDCLFMDTEFIRETTFRPIPALIQIHDGQAVYLLDPQAIRDWSPLAAVLTAERPLKLFHACQEDAEVLAGLMGAAPQGLLDTQLAAAFVGLGWSVGYGRLVENLGGGVIADAPHITRSNWLARPLSTAQRDYAVDDVRYLAGIWPGLQQRLQARDALAPCLQETALRAQQMLTLPEPENLWPQLPGMDRLSDEQRCVARRLCLWREATARSEDVARNRLLRDNTLVALARQQPASRPQLARLEDLRPGVLRRYGDALLDCIATGQADDPAQYPLPATASPLLLKTCLPAMKTVVGEVALRQDLPEALLASRNMLTALIQAWALNREEPAWLTGWREPLLRQDLQTVWEAQDHVLDTL